jgi:hypothetical protein
MANNVHTACDGKKAVVLVCGYTVEVVARKGMDGDDLALVDDLGRAAVAVRKLDLVPGRQERVEALD